MRTVSTADGRILAVREGGDPAGFPVLVLGGTPSSSLLYGPHLLDAKRRGIRLFSYDRPGYGDSTRCAGRVVADCANDVAAVCDALGIQQFCVWGASGGGPHALATAALLPDRVVAAAALAPLAPYDAQGLDFYAGRGDPNIEEFRAAAEGGLALMAILERDGAEILSTTPDQLVVVLRAMLGRADVAVLTNELAEYLLECTRAGIQHSLDGWLDDDLAFVRPWGFDLASIRVPVLHWQGAQDKFVPFSHGVWLSRHIPGVDSRLTPSDGHFTLTARCVPDVHAWLLKQSKA